MTRPSVRVVAGDGVALRTGDFVAWFTGAEPGPVVRAVVAAASGATGIPTGQLGGLARSTPGLAMAAVAFGEDFGRAWVCGEAEIRLDEFVARARPGAPTNHRFPLPCQAIHLGRAGPVLEWTHLVEGAVPAGGVQIAFEPPPVAVGATLTSPPEPEMVPGLRCASGHFNHPFAANCAWCGIDMLQASHVMVHDRRPPLGVFVVDGHTSITIDRDLVLGRRPSVRTEVDGDRVAEIVLTGDRSLSRAHAAVRLRGWDVLVEDLSSGIGTWLQQPGQPPFQVMPGHLLALLPGAVIQVGPHRLTYHSHFLR